MKADRFTPSPETLEAEVAAARVLDRVLLYLRGMDVPPARTLELALESLRRLEASATPLTMASAMKELHCLLRENKLHTGWVNRYEPPRGSTPPLNRCSMVAEEMEFLLWPRFRRGSRP